MTEKTDSSHEGTARTILTVAMDPADVEKLLTAFRAGELADLGIKDVNVLSQTGTHASKLDIKRHSKPPGDQIRD